MGDGAVPVPWFHVVADRIDRYHLEDSTNELVWSGIHLQQLLVFLVRVFLPQQIAPSAQTTLRKRRPCPPRAEALNACVKLITIHSPATRRHARGDH